MFRLFGILFGLIKLLLILAGLYVFAALNIVSGGGFLVLLIAGFFILKFLASTQKKG